MYKAIRKIVLAAIFALCICNNSNAQTWTWANNFNGAGDGTSICLDPSGNIFTTGEYAGTLAAGIYTLSNYASICAPYIIKSDANGNVLWAKTSLYTASSNNAYGMSVCSDANGNAICAGFYSDANIIFGTYTLTNNGSGNTFLIKYDPSGNILWAKNPTGTDYDCPYSVSCDANNNVYVCGTFSNSILVFGTTTLTSIGIQKMYLAKYDPNGNVLWATCNSVGEVFGDIIFGVTASTDPGGNSFVTGSFTTPTMILGTYTLTNGGSQNIFLAKYDSNGNVLWAKSAVGPSFDQANSVHTDGIGNIYVTGRYNSSSLVFGTTTITSIGGQNFFLAKYDNNGNALWVKNSNPTIDNIQGFSVSSNSLAVFVTGRMSASVTLGAYTATVSTTIYDPSFIAKYDPNGNVLFLQGLISGGDDWFAISANKYCNAYFHGDFRNINPFVIGTYTLIPTGTETPFTAVLSFSTNCQPSTDGIPQLPNSYPSSSVFPNPNNGSFTVQIDQNIKNGKLIIINSLGQSSHEQKILPGENKISTNKISKGLYHYFVLENEQRIGEGKLMIE